MGGLSLFRLELTKKIPLEMPILICLSDMGVGGTQKFVRALATWLVDCGYSVKVVILHPGVNDKLGFDRRVSVICNSSHWFLCLRDALIQDRNIAVISFLTTTNIKAWITWKLYGKGKLIFFERNSVHLGGFILSLLYRLAAKDVDLISANSREAIDYFAGINPSATRLPVYNFLDKVCDTNTPKIRDIDCLFVGSMTPKKRVLNIAKVFGDLSHRYFVGMIGSGPLFRDVQIIREHTGIKKNFMLVDGAEDILNYYKRAKVVVIWSQREGFPNVFLEAVAGGCDFIGSDCSKILSQEINFFGGSVLSGDDDCELRDSIIDRVHRFSPDRLKSIRYLEDYKVRFESQLLNLKTHLEEGP